MLDPNNPDIIRRGIQLELPCKLTDEERLQRAIEASKLRAAREELEANLDAAKEAAKDALAKHDAEVARLDGAVRDGAERRLVACYEIFKAGTIERRRELDNEIVHSRPATMAEAQRSIPGAEPAPAAAAPADDGAADGNDEASPEPDDEHDPFADADQVEDDGTGVVRAADGEHVGDVVTSSTGDGVFVAAGDAPDDDAGPDLDAGDLEDKLDRALTATVDETTTAKKRGGRAKAKR